MSRNFLIFFFVLSQVSCSTPTSNREPAAKPLSHANRESKPEGVDAYRGQDRGGTDAYLRYMMGMNKTARQKGGLSISALPATGVVADMGSGSGQQSADTANAFGNLKIIGVDINPVSVKLAQETHKAPNLEFRTGDVAEKLFPPHSLDGIIDSSVLHHVTSFNGFSLEVLRKALDNQVEQLKEGGVIIIRDFVVPRKANEKILLEIPTDLVPLFEDFCNKFKSSVYLRGGVPFERKKSGNDSFAHFLIDKRTATEFVLRKDYVEDWATEMQEEYTYFSQKDFERELRARGLRLVVSKEIFNPWIIKNRFKGKFRFLSQSGRELSFPATNYLIIAQKVSSNEGASFKVTQTKPLSSPRFLKPKTFLDKHTGEEWTLLHRDGKTVDVIPFFRRSGRPFVLMRKGYPRPLVSGNLGQSLGFNRTSGYIAEPITGIKETQLSDAESVSQVLVENLGSEAVSSLNFRSSRSLHEFFPSAGAVNELVRTVSVEVDFPAGQKWSNQKKLGLANTGTIQEVAVDQILDGFQVGGMFDTRLEIGVYQLLRSLGEALPKWVGAEIQLRDQGPLLVGAVGVSSFERPSEKRFVEVQPKKAPFFEVSEIHFDELSPSGETVGTIQLEQLAPKNFSSHTVSTLPVIRSGGEVYVGLEERFLPAAEAKKENARHIANPAWRIPKQVKGLDNAIRFAEERLKKDFGLEPLETTALGGEYFSSPGISSEVVYPYVVEVDAKSLGLHQSGLKWISLKEAIGSIEKFDDGHLVSSLFRLHHALSK